MKRIQIDQIPLLPYQGYLWYSDQSTPLLIDGEFYNAQLKDFPFVIEGLLWDKNSQTSIHIKHLNGEYVITQFDLSLYDKEQIHETQQIAHKLEGVSALRFAEVWEEQQESVLEDIAVLRPKAHIFIGFKYN